MIESFEIATSPTSIEKALTTTETLVAGPTQTTSWTMAWARASDVATVVATGHGADGQPLLVLPLETTGPVRLGLLRTVAFRHAAVAAIRTAAPAHELLDGPTIDLLHRELRSAGVRTSAVLLFDLEAPDPSVWHGVDGIGVLQAKTNHELRIPSDATGWEEAALSRKRVRRLQSLERKLEREVGDVTLTWAEPDELSAALVDLLAAKRRAIGEAGGSSRLEADLASAFYPALAAEVVQRGDLDVRCYELRAGGERLAADMGLRWGDQFHGLIRVFEPRHQKYGPGGILAHKLFGELAAGGTKRINFGKVNPQRQEPYATVPATTVDLALASGRLGRTVVAQVPRAIAGRRKTAELVPEIRARAGALIPATIAERLPGTRATGRNDNEPKTGKT